VALPFWSARANSQTIIIYNFIVYEQCRRRRPSSAFSATATTAVSNPDFGPSSLPAHVCTRGNPTSAVSLAETFSGKLHPPINIVCAPASWLYPRWQKALTYRISVEVPHDALSLSLSLTHTLSIAPLLDFYSTLLLPLSRRIPLLYPRLMVSSHFSGNCPPRKTSTRAMSIWLMYAKAFCRPGTRSTAAVARNLKYSYSDEKNSIPCV